MYSAYVCLFTYYTFHTVNFDHSISVPSLRMLGFFFITTGYIFFLTVDLLCRYVALINLSLILLTYLHSFLMHNPGYLFIYIC